MDGVRPELRQTVFRHSFLGLAAKQLLEGPLVAYERYEENEADNPVAWRFCWPTQYGHELFAWGLGLGDLDLRSYGSIPIHAIKSILPPLEVLKLEILHIHHTAKVRQY